MTGTTPTPTHDRSAAAVKSALEARLAFWWGLTIRLVLFAVGVYFFWRVRSILATVLAALVVSCAAQALVSPLCRRRVPFLHPHTQRFVATVGVYLFMALTIFWSFQVLLHPFREQFDDLMHNIPAYQTIITTKVTQLQEQYNNLPPDFRHFLDEQKTKLAIPSPAAWVGGALGGAFAWASHIVELILVPVLAFYFTLDGRKLRNQFLFLVPRERLRPTLAIFSEGGEIMRAYLVSQFLLAVIAGVLVSVGLSLVGMSKYAVVMGIVAGITRAVPVVGPLLGGIPIVLLSFVYGAQTGNPLLWVKVLAFFTLLHLVESKVIMPRFLGHALDLHAVVIIVALLIGGEFFGLTGMFLAAPVAALIRLLLLHYVIVPRRHPAPALVLTGDDAPLPDTRFATARRGGGRVLRLERAVRNTTLPPARD